MSDFLIKQIEATENTIKTLQEHAEWLRSMMEKETPKKWSPVGGDYYVNSDGDIHNDSASCRSTREFGVERPTQEQAERAAVEMRKFNRLLALRDELCGDGVVNWSSDEAKYYLCCNENKKTWDINFNFCQNNNGVYFTTIEYAQRACDMLNSGEVEL